MQLRLPSSNMSTYWRLHSAKSDKLISRSLKGIQSPESPHFRLNYLSSPRRTTRYKISIYGRPAIDQKQNTRYWAQNRNSPVITLISGPEQQTSKKGQYWKVQDNKRWPSQSHVIPCHAGVALKAEEEYISNHDWYYACDDWDDQEAFSDIQLLGCRRMELFEGEHGYGQAAD